MIMDWIPLDTVTLAIAAIVIGYIYMTWNHDYWKKRKVPFEKPKFFFGSYRDVFLTITTVGELMEDMYRKFDGHPFVGFWRLRRPGLLIRDLECVKTILLRDFNNFQENALLVLNTSLDPLMSRNPFFQHGTKWKNTRSLLTPSFTTVKLRPMFPLMHGVSEQYVEYLRRTLKTCGPDGFEAKDVSSIYIMEVVATCAFGISGGSFDNPKAELRSMAKKVIEPGLLKNIQMMTIIFWPQIANLLKISVMPKKVDQFFRRVVNDVVGHRQKNDVSRQDYLQLLINLKKKAQENASEPLTDEDITGHTVTFLTDGFETSSIVMGFTLYELARHPDEQETLRQEVDEALRGSGGQWSAELVADLPYLEQVMQEVLRIHTPLMQMEKLCTKDTKLRTEDGREFEVSAGTLVALPVRGYHMDPKYFPEPERFDPDRFSAERRDSIPKFGFLPFGEGPRMCLGMRFAMAQIKLGVATLVRNFHIKTTPKTPSPYIQDPNYFLRCAKGGAWITFAPRPLPG